MFFFIIFSYCNILFEIYCDTLYESLQNTKIVIVDTQFHKNYIKITTIKH